MTARLVILSDLHLGRYDGVRDARELESLVEPGAQLVLNGDTAEFQDPRVRDAAARAYDELTEIARSRSATLITLAGNHDPEISDARTLLAADGTVLVTHGDAFHPSVAPWSTRASAMRRAWEDSIAARPPQDRETLEAIFDAARAAGLAERDGHAHNTTRRTLIAHPRAIATIVGYWWNFARLASAFADRHFPTATIVIAGHSHHPGVQRFGHRTVVNTGSFARPCSPHAAVIEGDRLTLVPIRRRRTSRGRRYELADAPRASVALQAPLTLPIAVGNPARSSRDGNARPSAAPIPFPASSNSGKSTRVASPDLSHA